MKKLLLFVIPFMMILIYFVVQFMTGDINIKISKIPANVVKTYVDNSFIQGIAVSDDYIFAGYDTVKDSNKEPNSYYIRKLDRTTGEVLATSTQTFNHTNAMTYNSNTNELIVTALSDNNGVTDDDYQLYVVDANTLTLKTTIDLKEVALSVYSDAEGISQVAYNSTLDEYYIGIRNVSSSDAKRYVATLKSDFTLKTSIYLCDLAAYPGIMGDFFVDTNYIYIPNWRSDISNTSNEVYIYDKNGNLTETKSIDGVMHIEGMDYIDGKYYISFIASYNRKDSAQIYVMPEIVDIS